MRQGYTYLFWSSWRTGHTTDRTGPDRPEGQVTPPIVQVLVALKDRSPPTVQVLKHPPSGQKHSGPWWWPGTIWGSLDVLMNIQEGSVSLSHGNALLRLAMLPLLAAQLPCSIILFWLVNWSTLHSHTSWAFLDPRARWRWPPTLLNPNKPGGWPPTLLNSPGPNKPGGGGSPTLVNSPGPQEARRKVRRTSYPPEPHSLYILRLISGTNYWKCFKILLERNNLLLDDNEAFYTEIYSKICSSRKGSPSLWKICPRMFMTFSRYHEKSEKKTLRIHLWVFFSVFLMLNVILWSTSLFHNSRN